MKKKVKCQSERIHVRSIDRHVAKVKMKKTGICGMSKEDWKPRSPRETRLNKPISHHRSYFASHWREFSEN